MDRILPMRLGKEILARLAIPEKLRVREARLVIGATDVVMQLDILVTPEVATALGEALRAVIQATQPVFHRPECIYTYCPTPDDCRDVCRYHARSEG